MKGAGNAQKDRLAHTHVHTQIHICVVSLLLRPYCFVFAASCLRDNLALLFKKRAPHDVADVACEAIKIT